MGMAYIVWTTSPPASKAEGPSEAVPLKALLILMLPASDVADHRFLGDLPSASDPKSRDDPFVQKFICRIGSNVQNAAELFYRQNVWILLQCHYVTLLIVSYSYVPLFRRKISSTFSLFSYV